MTNDGPATTKTPITTRKRGGRGGGGGNSYVLHTCARVCVCIDTEIPPLPPPLATKRENIPYP